LSSLLRVRRGFFLSLAIQAMGREAKGKRAVFRKELVILNVGRWPEDELKDARADLGITDGEPELQGLMLQEAWYGRTTSETN